MGIFLLVVRLALAAVLVVSGIAKLFDRAGTRQAFEAFRLPARFAPAVAIALPVIELALAVTLFPANLVPTSAALATVLFLAFTAVVTRSVLHGDAVECNCFGQLSAAPVSWMTVARNALLTAATLAVWIHALASGADPIWDDPSSSDILIVLGFALCLTAIAGLTWLALQLWSQQGRLLLRLDELEARTDLTPRPAASPLTRTARPLPALDLTPVGDTAPALASLHRQKPLLLILSDPKCGPCNALMPEIARWQREYASWLGIAIITSGDAEAALAKSQEHGLANLYLQRERQASDALGTKGTPCALLVDPAGQIRGEAACGSVAIKDLVSSLLESRPPAAAAPVKPPSRIGQLVPMTKMTDLDGAQKFVGGPSDNGQLLVFWNPGCGFCNRMLPDLKALEAGWSADAPELVVVSQGDPEVNRNQGLQSLVVLDAGFGLGRSVGATGTPSAVLLDKGGRVVTDPAVGAPAILTLTATLT